MRFNMKFSHNTSSKEPSSYFILTIPSVDGISMTISASRPSTVPTNTGCFSFLDLVSVSKSVSDDVSSLSLNEVSTPEKASSWKAGAEFEFSTDYAESSEEKSSVIASSILSSSVSSDS